VSVDPELRARLQRVLRRARDERAPAQLPEEMRRRLTRREAAGPARLEGERDGAPHIERPGTTGMPRDVCELAGPHGSFAARTTWLDASAMHGDWSLAEVDHADGETLSDIGADESFASVDWRRAVYLDIETTGLGGGAGMYCYMVGLGRFEGERFELWQGFLRGPEEAPGLLGECAARIAAAECVVSFFGKSFDRHRLEDNMRCHGIAAPFAGRPHLDLYYPCRRLYGSAFDDGRLATMERELCGLERTDDLSGAFAPAAWFDYLAGREHLLEEVFRHNYLDVLSLVTLCAQLGRSVSEQRGDGRPLSGPAHARAEGLARHYFKGLDRERALLWIRRALERSSGCTRPQRLLEADCLRLLKRGKEAREAYLALAREGADEVAARSLCQAARLWMREDRASALECATRAQNLCEEALVGSSYARLQSDLRRLVQRCRA